MKHRMTCNERTPDTVTALRLISSPHVYSRSLFLLWLSTLLSLILSLEAHGPHGARGFEYSQRKRQNVDQHRQPPSLPHSVSVDSVRSKLQDASFEDARREDNLDLKWLSQQEASRKEVGKKFPQMYSNDTSLPISLHGNGVLVGDVRVYLIYYGNWSGPSRVIENFITSLSKPLTRQNSKLSSASDWWKMVMGYTNQQGQSVGKVVFGGRFFDNYTLGSDLTNKVATVVYNAIVNKSLPADSNASYMVLTSADVLESPGTGFCAGTYPFVGTPLGYCGWHHFFRSSKTGNIPYAFIGNANQCVKRCGHLEGYSKTPNGDVGIDAMVNVVAHELAETVTNWDVSTGWYDQSGQENADKCNRMWGHMLTTPKRKYVFNVVGRGGMRWLIQKMWDPSSQTCRMKSQAKSKQK